MSHSVDLNITQPSRKLHLTLLDRANVLLAVIDVAAGFMKSTQTIPKLAAMKRLPGDVLL